MNIKIGEITNDIINILNLKIQENTPIFIGDENIKHIKLRHNNDYEKYGKQIKDIIKSPTYVARNEKKNSIEYIKKYIINNEMVLVVVRASGKQKLFVRTMYVMSDEKIEKYKKYGYFKIYK